MKTVAAKSIKITIPIQADSLPTDVIPADGQPIVPIDLAFQCGDGGVSRNPKKFRQSKSASRLCRKTPVFRHIDKYQRNQPQKGTKNMRKTLSLWATVRKPNFDGYLLMLVGYIRVSTDPDRQSTDLHRNFWGSGLQPRDITLTTSLNGRSYKKAMKKAVPGAFAVVQGKFGPDNTIIEAGITVQPSKEPVS